MATVKKTPETKHSSPKEEVNKDEKNIQFLEQDQPKSNGIVDEWQNLTVTLGELKNLRTKSDLSSLFLSKNGKPQKILSTI